MKKRYIFAFLALAAVSLFIGVSDLSFMDLFSPDKPEERKVFFISRVPRLISILVAGACLTIAGVVMQQISANRFIAPSTAGTMELTRFGVLLTVMLMPTAGLMTKMSVAFVISLIGTYIFMQIITRIKLKDSIFIPLVGIMFGGIVNSVGTFFAYQYDLIQNIESWMLGSFSLVMRGRYELLYLGIPALVIVYIYARQFTIAALGGDIAANLGLRYKAIVNLGLVLCAFITSIVVVTVGSISFLGIIIPNIISIYKGDNLRQTLPLMAMCGSAYLLACDVLSRIIIYPYEVPVNVIAGTVGSALFIYLMLRNNDERA